MPNKDGGYLDDNSIRLGSSRNLAHFDVDHEGVTSPRRWNSRFQFISSGSFPPIADSVYWLTIPLPVL